MDAGRYACLDERLDRIAKFQEISRTLAEKIGKLVSSSMNNAAPHKGEAAYLNSKDTLNAVMDGLLDINKIM